MDENLKQDILRRVAEYPGHTTMFYQQLETGEQWEHCAKQPVTAASVIKLTVMVELFRQIDAGLVQREQKLTVRDEDRVPICGVLTMMHTGMEVTPIDLCWLMITISDNMATNMLIDLLGVDNIQQNNRRLGLEGMELTRKLFEKRPEFRGKRNTVSAWGSARLLEMIWNKQLVSAEASTEMLEMLRAQQCTNKMPLLLAEGETAHKTGEDDGVTHDVGIVFAKHPFLVCFCNDGLAPGTEGRLNILIGEITKELYDANGGAPDAQ